MSFWEKRVFDMIIYEYKNKLLLIDNACGIELSFNIDTRLLSLFSVWFYIFFYFFKISKCNPLSVLHNYFDDPTKLFSDL